MKSRLPHFVATEDGAAGAGKTWLLNHHIRWLREHGVGVADVDGQEHGPRLAQGSQQRHVAGGDPHQAGRGADQQRAGLVDVLRHPGDLLPVGADHHLLPQGHRALPPGLPDGAEPLLGVQQDRPAEVPPLIKGYLRAGAWICGEPAWDPDFNTADLPILLPMAKISNRYAKHYLEKAE